MQDDGLLVLPKLVDKSLVRSYTSSLYTGTIP